MTPQTFFNNPKLIIHKKYEALRAYFHENMPAHEVAKRFGYTTSSIYTMTKNFKIECKSGNVAESFFVVNQKGRKPTKSISELHKEIISLRKNYLSVPDIKAVLDSQGKDISERQIYNILKDEGFSRLPRRTTKTKDNALGQVKIEAPKSQELSLDNESFTTQNSIGILCLLPYLTKFGIDKAIEESKYPATKTIPKVSSILAFIALKLSNFARYTADDQWCMDRGLGLFAKLNVLPKAAWYSSYSHRVTREMNLSFLKQLNSIWSKNNLLSDTANLDFVTVPYWGDDAHLERNWSGTRGKALSSILAVLAQDPDTGIITYGDTNLKHDNKNNVAVEFLDFYKDSKPISYLVFDSKFTTYQNLRKLDDNNVKFITIRRRGSNIIKKLSELDNENWKTIRVPAAHKTRTLKVNDQTTFLRDYDKDVRQIVITGNSRIKPALIITNDFLAKTETIVRKYAQRWLVEQDIAEQTYFFHLNKVSSSMVIKVDFDLTMSILAHNIFRLFAQDLAGFENATAQTIFNKFILNSGNVIISDSGIDCYLKKKRNLPAILTAMHQFQNSKNSVLDNKKIRFHGASFS